MDSLLQIEAAHDGSAHAALAQSLLAQALLAQALHEIVLHQILNRPDALLSATGRNRRLLTDLSGCLYPW